MSFYLLSFLSFCTSSGTLAPHSQSQITHPRPGVAIIVQILTDLLRAASVHKGALANLSKHHCPDQNLPVKPQQTAEDGCKPRSKPNTTQSTLQFSDASGNTAIQTVHYSQKLFF